MKDNGTRDADAILASIEHTRSEMDSTLHAIEERLTPGQVFDQGLNYLRNSGGREFLSNLGASVRTNPMPVALVGVALAWLMVTNRHHSGGNAGGQLYDEDLQADRLRDGAAGAAAATRDKVADAAGATRERVASAVGAAKDKVAHAVDSARSGLSATSDRAHEAWQRTSNTTRQQIDRARTGYRYVVQEQPLALGAMGFGIGALLAAVAPRTEEEDRVMGRAADRVRERVAHAGREQLDRAEAALAEAAESMQATAQSSEAQRSANRPPEQQSGGPRWIDSRGPDSRPAESRPGDPRSNDVRERSAAAGAKVADSPLSGRPGPAPRPEAGSKVGPLDE